MILAQGTREQLAPLLKAARGLLRAMEYVGTPVEGGDWTRREMLAEPLWELLQEFKANPFEPKTIDGNVHVFWWDTPVRVAVGDIAEVVGRLLKRWRCEHLHTKLHIDDILIPGDTGDAAEFWQMVNEDESNAAELAPAFGGVWEVAAEDRWLLRKAVAMIEASLPRRGAASNGRQAAAPAQAQLAAAPGVNGVDTSARSGSTVGAAVGSPAGALVDVGEPTIDEWKGWARGTLAELNRAAGVDSHHPTYFDRKAKAGLCEFRKLAERDYVVKFHDAPVQQSLEENLREERATPRKKRPKTR